MVGVVAPSCCHPPLSHPPIHSPAPTPPPASYLLTRKDVFFTKSEFCQIISAMLRGKDARVKVDLPPPALWKVGHSAYGRKWVCGVAVVWGCAYFQLRQKWRIPQSSPKELLYCTSTCEQCDVHLSVHLNCCVCLFGGTAVFSTACLYS